jgi:hypothetical protein
MLYESVLGIQWKSGRSDASTDCYFTYVLDRAISKLRGSTEHRLDEHDLDDCRQVTWLHAQRCIKYFDPDKAKISTFVTRLVRQGVHKFLTEHYKQGDQVTFSSLDTEDTPFAQQLEGTLTYEVDIFVTENCTAAIPRPATKRARRKGEQQESLFDPEDD